MAGHSIRRICCGYEAEVIVNRTVPFSYSRIDGPAVVHLGDLDGSRM